MKASPIGRVLRLEGRRRVAHDGARGRVHGAGRAVDGGAPGGVDTPIIHNFGPPADADWKLIERLMSPIGFAYPHEVAGAFAYLGSSEADYITGAILSIDGRSTTSSSPTVRAAPPARVARCARRHAIAGYPRASGHSARARWRLAQRPGVDGGHTPSAGAAAGSWSRSSRRAFCPAPTDAGPPPPRTVDPTGLPTDGVVHRRTDVVRGTNFWCPDRSAAAVVAVLGLAPLHHPEMCTGDARLPRVDPARSRPRRVGPHGSAFVAVRWWRPSTPIRRRGPVVNPGSTRPAGRLDMAAAALWAVPPPGVERTAWPWDGRAPEDLPGLVRPSARWPGADPTSPWSSPAHRDGARRPWTRPLPPRACARGSPPGWVEEPDLAALLSRAGLLAFPSLYEGFGFPPLQAMRAGVPWSTRAGSLPEVLATAPCWSTWGSAASSRRWPPASRRGGTPPPRCRGAAWSATFMGALW